MSATPNPRDIVCLLKLSALTYGRAHYWISEGHAKKNGWITTFIIIFSILVTYLSASGIGLIITNKILTIGVFSHDGKNSSDYMTGFLGALMVSLSSWHYFVAYSERHIKHGFYAAEYFNLFRKICRLEKDQKIDENRLHNLNFNLNILTKHAPIIPKKFLTQKIQGKHSNPLSEIEDGFIC
jgi:hypothetical protein